ncbi:MAG: hypothetical protein JW779_10865 [Candidatus Thorarchaeota archaeon]|nr:hypothetical protein [Candidatus Thorarchaeota archaeon]
MGVHENFQEEMQDICKKYFDLLQQKKAIDEQLESLHNYLEVTMQKYDREEYDDPEVPVKVDKIVYTSERMKRGAKEKLRELLTTKQWSDIFKTKEIVSYRVTPRDE